MSLRLPPPPPLLLLLLLLWVRFASGHGRVGAHQRSLPSKSTSSPHARNLIAVADHRSTSYDRHMATARRSINDLVVLTPSQSFRIVIIITSYYFRLADAVCCMQY
jgi:hypothetical protein